MIVRERFAIAALVAQTGVPPATIHHYVRRGLLPAPRKVAANRFLYDERHVQGLRLIKMLRQRRRLPLKAIKRILPDLLGLEQDQAFRAEMWDHAVDIHLREFSRRAPAARLLVAAKDAFARRGYEAVNVDEICRAARVAKGSFYRHYRAKEELFFAVAEATADEIADAFATGPADADSLARTLAPLSPILLDLLARAVQRRPGYRAAAARAFGRLARRVGEHVGGRRDPRLVGEELVERALGRVLRDVAGGDAATIADVHRS